MMLTLYLRLCYIRSCHTRELQHLHQRKDAFPWCKMAARQGRCAFVKSKKDPPTYVAGQSSSSISDSDFFSCYFLSFFFCSRPQTDRVARKKGSFPHNGRGGKTLSFSALLPVDERENPKEEGRREIGDRMILHNRSGSDEKDFLQFARKLLEKFCLPWFSCHPWLF